MTTFGEYRKMSKKDLDTHRGTLDPEKLEMFDAILEVLDAYETGGEVGTLGAAIVNAILEGR